MARVGLAQGNLEVETHYLDLIEKLPGGFWESKLVRSLVGLVATSTRDSLTRDTVSFESLAPTSGRWLVERHKL